MIPTRAIPTARRRAARGSVLVEFALISLAFFLLVSAVITFGTMIHTAQVAQDASRVAARELALIPLPADATFDDALADPTVKATVYDPDLLVIDLDLIPGGLDLDTYFGTLPAVNRALRPAMILDIVESGGAARRLLRAPGALILSNTAPSGLSVAVPVVVTRDADGIETIEWRPVLEEVRSAPADPATGPFSVLSTSPVKGMAAVRVNLPSQSSAMPAFQAAQNPLDPNLDRPVLADDSGVQETNAAPGTLADLGSVDGFHAYSGKYGLGRVHALAKQIRPFRRVLTGQAFVRREVFAEQSQP